MISADLRFYLYLAIQRLPLMIPIAAVVSGIGLMIVLSIPPVYRASGTIMAESPQVATNSTRSGEAVGALARFHIIQQELLTQDALANLAERHELYDDAAKITPAAIAEDLRGRIDLNPVLFGDNIDALGFSVSFEADEPELAAEVANDLIATILQRDLSSRTERVGARLSFFEEEVARTAQALASIEVQLQNHKTRNLQSMPDTLNFRRSMQINIRDRLLLLDREKTSLESRRAGYIELYRRTGNVPDESMQTPEQLRLAELNAALRSQRMIFTEDSPAIMGLLTQIATVEAQISPEQGNSGSNANGSSLDFQLAEISDRLDAIEAERNSLEHSDAELTASIKATPANEAALNALERDYENAQSIYNAAVARLAEASTGEQIEARLQGEKLSLMEPALPPERPVAPKRFLLALLSIGIGGAAAIAVALGLELLNERVRRPVEIERRLGIEVMTSIPYIRADSSWSALRLARWVVVPLIAIGVILL